MAPSAISVLLAAAAAAASRALAADIYVATNGLDTNAGTLDAPLASIQAAVDAAKAGTTIHVRNGTYSPATNIKVKSKCTSAAPCTLMAHGNETVVVDGEALTGTPAAVGASLANSDRGVLHVEGAQWWRFEGLTFINGPYGVYVRDAAHNRFERIVTRENYETGFHMQGNISDTEVLFLDSYLNRDPRKNGESADGFACKEGKGEGVVLRGARLWNNVDDGLDLWEFKSGVTIVDTVSWGNGFNRWGFPDFGGDGNGFKLGGGNAGDVAPANHSVTNCVAFANAADGFTDNSQTGEFSLRNNTAWLNGGEGFHLKTATATLRWNVAAANGGGDASLKGKQTSSDNSWDNTVAASAATWSNASFVSVDPVCVQAARGADGGLGGPCNFLRAKDAAIGAVLDW